MTNDFAPMKEIVLRLREKRDEQKLSYADINALIEANGDYALNKATLSRVFSEGSEQDRFDYEDTIRPLAKALLDIETIEETDTDDVKTLKALLKVKMQRIEELELQVEREQKNTLEKVDEERKAHIQFEQFLKEQLSYKDKRMDEFMESVKEKDRQIAGLTDHILNCPYRCSTNETGEAK